VLPGSAVFGRSASVLYLLQERKTFQLSAENGATTWLNLSERTFMTQYRVPRSGYGEDGAVGENVLPMV
jgi:hypothetical protein